MRIIRKIVLFSLATIVSFAFIVQPVSLAKTKDIQNDHPHKQITQYNQGKIIEDGTQFKNGPYYDSGVVGIIYAGDTFEDYNEVQNNYRKIRIGKSQDVNMQGIMGWVDQAYTSLQ